MILMVLMSFQSFHHTSDFQVSLLGPLRLAAEELGEMLARWVEGVLSSFPPASFRTKQQLFKRINKDYKNVVLQDRVPLY